MLLNRGGYNASFLRGSGPNSEYTKVPELQDEERPKSLTPPPPTAQTAGPNWLKFFLEALLDDAFRIIEAIFEFCPRS